MVPFNHRTVRRTPLDALWDNEGIVSSSRLRPLQDDDIRELLRNGPVRFVVIQVGLKPEWIPLDHCFRFRKEQVQSRLLPRAVYTDQIPELGGYWAEEWRPANGPPIVALELVS